MLFDPKWDQKTETKPLDRFITWLASMPADAEYEFVDSDHCAIAQWRKSEGCRSVRDYSLSLSDICKLLGSDAADDVVAERPWTFGAALKRARKLAA